MKNKPHLVNANGEIICCLCRLTILQDERWNNEHYYKLKKDGGTQTLISHQICNAIRSEHSLEDWEKNKYELLEYALKHWNIKHKDKKIIKRILNQREKQ